MQIGKTTPVFGHVQSQCTNIMRERESWGTQCFAILDFGRGSAGPVSTALKDAARVFWTRVQQKGGGVLGGSTLTKGVVRELGE